jgi:SAM-dependent methyltransferase
MALFVVSAWTRANSGIVVLAGIAFAAAASFWGYCYRVLKFAISPSLDHLHKRQYAATWDALASSPQEARIAACGAADEKHVRLSAQRAVSNITELAGIGPSDHLLEIGCGVARIGLELAPRCQRWTGVDISQNMLACAADRLSQLGNVHLVHLQASNLDSLPDSSFDLVYSTNMFDHLDQMDRCRYIQDAFRVLRPSGRFYVDNTDLESDAGWAAFANGVATLQNFERAPYQPTLATEAELTAYAKRAGFVNIHAHHRSPLVILTAIKP